MWVSMPELEDILGKEAAARLTTIAGGIRHYVPTMPDEAHKLTDLVGEAGARALCLAYGGTWIFLPNGNRPEPHKNRVLDLLAKGVGKRQIAKDCKVTERYVYLLAKGMPGKKKKERHDQYRLPIPES